MRPKSSRVVSRHDDGGRFDDITLDRQYGPLGGLLHVVRRSCQHLAPPGNDDDARPFFGHALGGGLAYPSLPPVTIATLFCSPKSIRDPLLGPRSITENFLVGKIFFEYSQKDSAGKVKL